jgi:hypothetical protein
LVDVVRRLYTDLKVVLKLGKLKTEILQEVGVRQGDNMAPVLFLFLMTAFADLIEVQFTRAGILRPEMVRESDATFHKAHMLRHDIRKCRKSRTKVCFIVDLTIYVDDTAIVFTSREQLEKGVRLIQGIFKSLGMEMHIGKQTSETTYDESKTECLYVPTAKELNQRAIEMELSKDDILLLNAEEEEQSETQRMRRRKLEDKIYESSSETLPVEVEGGIITYCPDFKYLGDWLSYNLKADKALEMRKAAMTKAIGSLKVFFDRKEVCLKSKYLIFMAIPVNFLLWGCESWAVCKHHLSMLQSHVNKKIRRIIKLTMWDVKEQRITNEQLLQRFCNKPLIQTRLSTYELVNFWGNLFMDKHPLRQGKF